MADMTLFMRHILPHAKECLEPVAMQYLRDAAIEFCRRTRCWRHQVEVSNVPGIRPVIPLPEGAALYQVERARINERMLEPGLHEEHMWDDKSGGLAHEFSVSPANELIVVPEEEGTVYMSLFLVPSQDTEELPDFMLEDHGEKLGCGALAKILMLPNQPFTSYDMASLKRSEFVAYLDSNFDLQKKGKQRARIRSKASWF